MVVFAAMLGPAHAQVSEVVLHNFGTPSHGANPRAGLWRDSAGNLYGTTVYGGAASLGVVFKLSPSGQQTVLHQFAGGKDGAVPYAGVIGDSAGNLYGTTSSGGASGYGTVFKIDPTGHETILYSFTKTNGAQPYGGLVLDSAGNLYGATELGGSNNLGVIFKIDTTGKGSTLYTFTNSSNGNSPLAGLILDSAGNLYGTTMYGGANGRGNVFQLSPTGTLTVLYSFTGGTDGGYPSCTLVRDSAGNLYGTAGSGGTKSMGVVFKLDTAGNETVLYNFKGGADGSDPIAGVARDASGNFYGTTYRGGSANFGVVYKIDTTNKETLLHTFTNGADGATCYAGVIVDPAGNLYGTTYAAGLAGLGVVYKVDAAGQETVLYGFPGATGGVSPSAGLTSAGSYLYSATALGGTYNQGVVYKLDSSGHETVLYTFTGGADGGGPIGTVAVDSGGNVYGTTQAGGISNNGVVYKVDTSGKETVLHSFTGSPDGADPKAGVVLDPAGNLYGTTYGGGASNAGTVFKVDSTGQETVLYNFTGGSDGGMPEAEVTLDSSGNIYGTALAGGANGVGVVFKINSSDQYNVFYSFLTVPNGAGPKAGVIFDSAGNLYGTTSQGGPSRSTEYGAVYKLSPAAQETVLFYFSRIANGGTDPTTGVVLDSAGNVFGTTSNGGPAKYGTVYKIDTAGTESIVYSFTGGADGGIPDASLIVDSSGNLFGTASYGGKSKAGVVFEIKGAAAAAAHRP